MTEGMDSAWFEMNLSEEPGCTTTSEIRDYCLTNKMGNEKRTAGDSISPHVTILHCGPVKSDSVDRLLRVARFTNLDRLATLGGATQWESFFHPTKEDESYIVRTFPNADANLYLVILKMLYDNLVTIGFTPPNNPYTESRKLHISMFHHTSIANLIDHREHLPDQPCDKWNIQFSKPVLAYKNRATGKITRHQIY